MRYTLLPVIILCILSLLLCTCGEKKNNRIPRKQLSSDGSHDYKYIFKDEIKKEEEEKKKMNIDPFK